MGALAWIKRNSRRVSDATAGTDAYFELATTNLSLKRAIERAVREHARGRLLDAGAGRQAYRGMVEPLVEQYESLDADEACAPDHVGDIQRAPLPDDTYDTVLCTQVLQHVPAPWDAVEEMARLLKPGGRLLVTAPHLVWLHNEPHDYFRFTGHGLRALFERAGLRAVHMEPVGGLVCFLAYGPSNVLLSALWSARPVFWVGFHLHRLAIRLALCADRVVGLRSLYPTNFLAVAEKPTQQ